MSIDNLLDRTWSKDYTCNEFACEAWKQITGHDLTQRLNEYLNGKGKFKRLDQPISPCLVFFSNNARSATHIGIFYDHKLLHLSQKGVQFIPLELVAMGFREVRFYT
ncbi:hypothetical protein [Acinetobacter sp. ANC 4639]